MSKNKVIGVDIDGVLADFNGAYIDLMIEIGDRDLFPPRPFDIPTWNYPEHYGYTKKEVNASWDAIRDSLTFWSKLKPLPGTDEFLLELDRVTDNLYFVTSRVGKSVKWQTEWWLKGFLGYSPAVLISSEKGECCHALKVDYYLDDKNENCADVSRRSLATKGYMLAQPWNQEQPGIPRLSALSEFLTIIKGV